MKISIGGGIAASILFLRDSTLPLTGTVHNSSNICNNEIIISMTFIIVKYVLGYTYINY